MVKRGDRSIVLKNVIMGVLMVLDRVTLLFCLALVLAGCRAYEARPLVSPEILEEVEKSRDLLPWDEKGSPDLGESRDAGSGFPGAAIVIARKSPVLREVRAEYRQARAVAEMETPLPNPTLAAGPLVGSNLGEGGSSHRVKPLVEFGFTIPLSRRLSFQDDVNAAEAESARVRIAAEHRRQYIELRGLYTEWVLLKRRGAIENDIKESTRKSLDLLQRLVKAGAASALDLGLMELEVAGWETAIMETRSMQVVVEGKLSRLVGIHSRHLGRFLCDALPTIDPLIPDPEAAKQTMLANHPRLAEQRADYEVAERQLRLEIEKQYPDLEIGTSFEGDPGETRKVWGLTLGIALPLFDRNQQAIVQAEQEREKIRVAYESTLNRALADLEALFGQYAISKEKHQFILDTVLPGSRRNLDVAHRSIRAGAIDSLKYLEVERALRTALVDALNSEKEIRMIVVDMEKIMGVPIALFPGEADEIDPPELPEPERERGK